MTLEVLHASGVVHACCRFKVCLASLFEQDLNCFFTRDNLAVHLFDLLVRVGDGVFKFGNVCPQCGQGAAAKIASPHRQVIMQGCEMIDLLLSRFDRIGVVLNLISISVKRETASMRS